MKTLTYITLLVICLFTIIDARRLIVIRHGEKISDDYIGLSTRGKARANCLYKIFNENTSYGRPTSIYSNKRGNRSHRPYDTVKPLADRYGLKVQEFSKYEPEKFVRKTLNKDKSHIVLLSSAREWIPSLLKAMGYRYNKEVEDFDNVWVINDDDRNGGGRLTVKKQNIESCINAQLYGKKNIKKTTKKSIKPQNKKTKKNTTTKKRKVVTKKIAVRKYKCGAQNKNKRCPSGYCCNKYGNCVRC